MDELSKAYHACDFDEFDKLKMQIYNLRGMMNSVDKFISEHQIPKILEG